MADLRAQISSLVERFTKRASTPDQNGGVDKAHAIDEGDPTRTIVSDDPSRNPDNR